MAGPWQTDTASCRFGYDPRDGRYLPTFWPARVPNHVLPRANYDAITRGSASLAERPAAFRDRRLWFARIPVDRADSIKFINEFVRVWGRYGIVTVPTHARVAAGDYCLIAAGDAAAAYDPLSSHGIATALATGWDAAATTLAALDGHAPPATEAYGHRVRHSSASYLEARTAYYNLEPRGPNSPSGTAAISKSPSKNFVFADSGSSSSGRKPRADQKGPTSQRSRWAFFTAR